MSRLVHHACTSVAVCCRYFLSLFLETENVKTCDYCGSEMQGKRESYGSFYKCPKCERTIYTTT